MRFEGIIIYHDGFVFVVKLAKLINGTRYFFVLEDMPCLAFYRVQLEFSCCQKPTEMIEKGEKLMYAAAAAASLTQKSQTSEQSNTYPLNQSTRLVIKLRIKANKAW